MASCFDEFGWSDLAVMTVILIVAVLWKSVETFLEQ